MAVAGAKGGLRDVLGGNTNLVVPGAEVDLGEHLGTVQAVQELINAGQGVGVADGLLVQSTVVDAEAKAPILLLTKSTGAP